MAREQKEMAQVFGGWSTPIPSGHIPWFLDIPPEVWNIAWPLKIMTPRKGATVIEFSNQYISFDLRKMLMFCVIVIILWEFSESESCSESDPNVNSTNQKGCHQLLNLLQDLSLVFAADH